MTCTVHTDPSTFLAITQKTLEANEIVHGLMLGIATRLTDNPHHYGPQDPLLATVTNGPDLELAALMTPPYKLQIAAFTTDPARHIAALADKLHTLNLRIPAVLAEEACAAAFASAWTGRTGTDSTPGMRQRIYVLKKVTPSYVPNGHMRQATVEDLPVVTNWHAAFHATCFGDGHIDGFIKAGQALLAEGNIYVWDHDGPVAMAALVRPTANGISITNVYTPPEHRWHGYASALVAALSQRALDGGRSFCTLYTDLGNPTSNSIYQKIGYTPVTDVMDINFKR